jgi:hypothetical protein
VLSVTPQGFIVHWPRSYLDDSYPDSSRVIAMAEILPYQDGDSLLSDDHSSTKILESSGMMESTTNRVSVHAREVFMVRGRSPLHAPTLSDINSDDESPSAISPDALGASNETKAEKTVRKKKNKQRAGHRICSISLGFTVSLQQSVQPHTFQVGYLVLRRIQKTDDRHKFLSPWEGPFIVSKVTYQGHLS